MRKFKNTTISWKRNKVETRSGLCTLCGGKGRYKITYKYKNPVFHHCWECRGTGKMEVFKHATL